MEADAPAGERTETPLLRVGAARSRRSRSSASGGCSSAPTRWRTAFTLLGRLAHRLDDADRAGHPARARHDRADARAAVRAARARASCCRSASRAGARSDGPRRRRRRPVRDHARSARRAWHPSSTSSSDDRDAETDDRRADAGPDPHGDAARRCRGRGTMPAGTGLIVMLVALLVWALLYAPEPEARLRGPAARHPAHRLARGCSPRSPRSATSCSSPRSPTARSAPLGRDPERGAGRRDVDVDPACPTLDPRVTARRSPTSRWCRTPKIRRPTPTNELRVVVVGRLARAGPRRLPRARVPPGARATVPARVGSRRGSSRLDYFDWLGRDAADRERLLAPTSSS